jgi:hypothetical protein
VARIVYLLVHVLSSHGGRFRRTLRKVHVFAYDLMPKLRSSSALRQEKIWNIVTHYSSVLEYVELFLAPAVHGNESYYSPQALSVTLVSYIFTVTKVTFPLMLYFCVSEVGSGYFSAFVLSF